ncbi:MAG: hypothetical protein DMD91_15685 [Candidatus Rokuibacteriota bacterium]|nr:MAG: hypothetical protein DMD91_15685 [Candidatus Rokubacteria bacterium]
MTDAERILRKVGALRSMCVRLPHLETPAETLLLDRFDALASVPDHLTASDRDAVAVGWRRSWRAGEVDTVHRMAPRLDGNMVANDRTLATLWVAATALPWDTAQQEIWRCTTCEADPRVAVNVRQQTEPPARPVSLLIVTLAPPFVTARERSRAASATNDETDRIRWFIEDTLGAPWTMLSDGGVFLLHAVKCAIVRDAHGSQNPPARTVDRCAPQHLASELNVIRPRVLVTMGRMAYRAVVRALEVSPRLALTEPPMVARTDGSLIDSAGQSFRLFASPFIRTPRLRTIAAEILTRAARVAGIAPTRPSTVAQDSGRT